MWPREMRGSWRRKGRCTAAGENFKLNSGAFGERRARLIGYWERWDNSSQDGGEDTGGEDKLHGGCCGVVDRTISKGSRCL